MYVCMYVYIYIYAYISFLYLLRKADAFFYKCKHDHSHTLCLYYVDKYSMRGADAFCSTSLSNAPFALDSGGRNDGKTVSECNYTCMHIWG